MKKQDVLTLIGVVIGAAMLVWGMALGGANIMIFWDFSSLVITVFGSFCALLVNYPISEFKKLGKVLLESFKEPVLSPLEMVRQFGSLSKKARKDGLLSLEDDISKLEDEFLKKGLQMVVDGVEPETIKDIMELEIDEMERRHITGANILKAWGGYAPAFGMIGTLIGLIQMLSNLTDSNAIASGMAKALITTYYGAVMANLFLNPMSANLSLKSKKEVSVREMMLEGILAIQSGVNPRTVEEKLVTYLSPQERREHYGDSAIGQEGVING